MDLQLVQQATNIRGNNRLKILRVLAQDLPRALAQPFSSLILRLEILGHSATPLGWQAADPGGERTLPTHQVGSTAQSLLCGSVERTEIDFTRCLYCGAVQ